MDTTGATLLSLIQPLVQNVVGTHKNVDCKKGLCHPCLGPTMSWKWTHALREPCRNWEMILGLTTASALNHWINELNQNETDSRSRTVTLSPLGGPFIIVVGGGDRCLAAKSCANPLGTLFTLVVVVAVVLTENTNKEQVPLRMRNCLVVGSFRIPTQPEMGTGGVEIMKGAAGRKPTPARERSTRQYVERSSWQWYTIKEENWISPPLNGSCKSIMQMKASIDGCGERAGCLNPSGTSRGSVSGEHPPLCRGARRRGVKRKLNFGLARQKSTPWVLARRGLTCSFRLETWRSGVEGGGRRFSLFFFPSSSSSSFS